MRVDMPLAPLLPLWVVTLPQKWSGAPTQFPQISLSAVSCATRLQMNTNRIGFSPISVVKQDLQKAQCGYTHTLEDSLASLIMESRP